MSKTICFDLRALQIGHEKRGIGMYIKSVLENMPNDDNKYIFYCFDKNNPIKKLGIKTIINYELIQIPTVNTVLDSPKNISGILRLINHRFSALKPHRPDTFVQFDFTLGAPRWRGTKNVIIGYDLIPLIMRSDYLPTINFAWNHSAGKKAKLKAVLRSIYYRYRYRLHYKVFKRADKIVCISKNAARTFENLLNIASKKLIPSPLAPVLSSAESDSAISKKVGKPYIFYIGGTDNRKRIQDIVYAFNIARGRGSDFALVLAGNEFQEIEKIPDVAGRNAILHSPYRDNIHLVGFVSDAEKMGLYNHAHAFVFTTTYEGFGLPVLEAMSASCPVITYDNSSIPEAAGDAALMIPTGDYVSIANKIIDLEDETLRNTLIKKGRKQAARFTWKKHVDTFRKTLL